MDYKVCLQDYKAKQLKNGLLKRSLMFRGDFDQRGSIESQGIPILGRGIISSADLNIRASSDFVNLIKNEKSGYLGHNITRVIAEDVPNKDAIEDKYLNYDRINKTPTLRSELIGDMALYGSSYTLYYIEENEVYTKKFFPWNAEVFYNEKTGTPEAGYVYVAGKEKDRMYIYDSVNREEYVCNKENDASSDKWELVESAPHGFGRVPLIQWKNNSYNMGNAERVLSYIDAYDLVVSDTSTEQSAIRQAILVLKDVEGAGSKDAGDDDDGTGFMEKVQKAGAIEVGEGGEVSFTEKNLNPDFARMVLDELEKNIFRFANIVDSDKLINLSQATQKQISFLYRSMDNDCDITEKQMQWSLELEDRLLKSFWTTIDTKSLGDYDTFKIDYVFIRNKPVDELADLEAMQRAGVPLPAYKKIMMALGVAEEKARLLAEEALSEITVDIGGFDDTENTDDTSK
jgi:SPP1 family phage portal protein